MRRAYRPPPRPAIRAVMPPALLLAALLATVAAPLDAQRRGRERRCIVRGHSVRCEEVERRDDDRRHGRAERPRFGLGAGLDLREFGDDNNRYLAQATVDFRGRSGAGVRPEFVYGWTDEGEPATYTLPGGGVVTVPGSRARMLGVAVSGTYAFLRGSPVRPYVLSGVGLFSTRETIPAGLLGGGAADPAATVRRTSTKVGLTAGTGLEFDVGPLRLYAELRYLLHDDDVVRRFNGMLPITAGIRF